VAGDDLGDDLGRDPGGAHDSVEGQAVRQGVEAAGLELHVQAVRGQAGVDQHGDGRGAGAIELADYAWNAMDSHIYGYTLQKLNHPFEPQQYPEAAETYLPQLPSGRYPHLTELTVHVMEGHHDGVPEFTFGLDLILDGLERLLAAT
jgi:hypothetical protein